MQLRVLVLGSLLTLGGCASIGQDAAEQSERTDSARWPTLGARGGAALLTNFDSEVRLDSQRFRRGTAIDLEDEFGLDQEVGIARADLWWRLDDDRRHRLELSWFDIRRSGSRRIQREIRFGDRVFAIDTSLQAYFNTSVVKGNYRYNFWVDDDLEVGASLGVHLMGIDVGIAQQDIEIEESFDTPAPLPVLGLHAEWLLAERIRLLAAAEGLYVELEDVGGMFGTEDAAGYLVDARAGIEWEPIDHLGFGVGFNYFRLDGEYGEQLLSLAATYEYAGVLLYGTLSF